MSATALTLRPVLLPPAPPSREQERWMGVEAIIERTGFSERSVRRYLNTGTILSRDSSERERNGKFVREYLVLSLPEELRAKLQELPTPKPEAVSPRPSAQLEHRNQLASLFPAPAMEAQRIAPPTDQADAQARERFAMIEPLLSFDRAKYQALRLSDGRAVTTGDLMAEYIAETQTVEGKRVSKRTLWRWVAQFRHGSMAALARKTRDDQGSSRFFTRYSSAAVLVAAEYHVPYGTYQRAYDALLRDRELLQIPDGEMPSYTTVRNFLDSLPEPMKILAREGLRRYNERCAPHLQRAYTDIDVNEIWVADHQIHDVEVRNDCMIGAPMDAPIRLQLTCLMDMRSRKIVGYCWTVDGDWRSIATALRRAVERYGPPKAWYSDNGADFKKAAKGAESSRRKDAVRNVAESLSTGPLQQLGIAVQYCIPYSPQSKPIERLFRTIHGRLDAIMPHYTTGNAYTRPDQTILAGAEHRKLMKMGMGAASSLMPASCFIKLAETWIEQYNAGHHHRGRGMNGHTPNEIFDEGYPLSKRRVSDPDVLAMLLHERRTVLVRRTAVTIDGIRYMPLQSSPESWVAIHNANETQITVAYDPLDPNAVIALDARGCRMATLVAERLVEHPGLDKGSRENSAQISDMMSTRRRLLSATAGTVKQIHRSVALAGHKTDLQHLAEMAGLEVPVDELVSQRAIRQQTKASDTATAPASSFDIATEILGDLA